MSKQKYLVTGGTGFIGAGLVRRLLMAGHEVKVFDNQSRGAFRRVADIRAEIEIVEGDVRDADSVSKAVAGADCVCHLAFVNGTEFFYTKPELVLEVGVKGMVNVLDACIKHSVRDFVLASSSEVYQTPSVVPTPESVSMVIPEPHNPRYSYAGGKIISELMTINYARKHFERSVIFRPHNVYGPDMGWEHVVPQFLMRMMALVEQNIQGHPIAFPIQGSGKETRSFNYVEDFLDGLMLVIERGLHQEIYHIGDPNEIEIAHLAKVVADYFDVALEVVPGSTLEGGTPRRCPDITKLSQLGYKPKYSIEQGVSITGDWYRENSHLNPALTKIGVPQESIK